MYEKLKTILIEEMSISPELITPDAELANDLGLNSLELADLVVICEEKFDMVFDDSELQSFTTVGDIANYIEQYSK